MVEKVKLEEEALVSSMYKPRLGPIQAEALFGPLFYIMFAITSLKALILALVWVALFGVLHALNMTPISFIRSVRNSMFGGMRPCRSYNRYRTQYLGDPE